MSYLNNTDATYDRVLLSSHPEPTWAEKQEGYNIDLLDESRGARAPSLSVSNHEFTDHGPLTDSAAVARPSLWRWQENGGEPAVAKEPWYCRRWVKTATVIVIVLIIGGIVGGVVRGTHHSSKKSSDIGGGNPNPHPNSTSTGVSKSFGITSVNPTTGFSVTSTASTTSSESKVSPSPSTTSSESKVSPSPSPSTTSSESKVSPSPSTTPSGSTNSPPPIDGVGTPSGSGVVSSLPNDWVGTPGGSGVVSNSPPQRRGGYTQWIRRRLQPRP